VSALLMAERLWLVVLLLLVATMVTLHLYTLPSESRVPSID
jgi:hypothetical protein